MSFLPRLRLVLALAGLVFAIAGVATDSRIITWAAIGLLTVSVVLRLVLRKRSENQE